jgi:hypothetical protein
MVSAQGKLGLDFSRRCPLRVAVRGENAVDADTNELVTRLSTAVGMIMEDHFHVAVSQLGPTADEVDATLDVLERATRDANLLVVAAQVLARRNIR